MSSDRSKLSCLKKLAEVEQYIWQDKREPQKIGDFAQLIIDRSFNKSDDIAGLFRWFERKFVSDVLVRTKNKQQLWIIGIIDGWTGHYIEDRNMEAELSDGGHLKTGGFLGYLEAHLGRHEYSLSLTDEERKVFRDVLENPFKYNCLIRRRDGTTISPPHPGDINFG